ncbi:hypothetical protein chiPu_0032766, partial [Chiloscyllium punctatum]|nr:hypothetical protein [Chiloscyllium punctatum]
PLQQEDGLKLTFHKQRRKRRKKLEMEAERARLCHYMRGLQEAQSQSASDSGQETSADPLRPTSLTPSALLDHSSPLKVGVEQEQVHSEPGAVHCQLDVVLSTGTNPLWRHSVNGQLADRQALAKRKRGRRKNVEGTEQLLPPRPTAHSKGLYTVSTPRHRGR